MVRFADQGKYTVYSLIQMSQNFIGLSIMDSASIYLDRASALSILREYNQPYILLYLAITYYKAGDYSKAKARCEEALKTISPIDSVNVGRLYLVLAGIYNSDVLSLDSANYYAYKAQPFIEQSKDIIDLRDLYELLYNVELKRAHFEKAFHYKDVHLAYNRAVEYAHSQLWEEREKYLMNTFQFLENEKEHSHIKSRIYLLVGCFCSLLFILGVICYFYMQWYIQKQRDEQFRLLAEIRTIKKAGRDDRLKLLFQIKDIAKIYEAALNKQDVRNMIKELLMKQGWDEVYPILNNAFDGLLERFRIDLELEEKDYRTCCIAYAGFGQLVVSAIMDESENTSKNRLTKVRKSIGITEQGGDIRDFLNAKYGISPD